MPAEFHLRPEFLQLERRLRSDWAQDVPTPPGLKHYKRAWLDTLKSPLAASNGQKLSAAIRPGHPTLVGDFHSLRRARHALAKIIREFPEDQSPALLLELLPAGRVWNAEELLERSGVRLVDGRSAAMVYR